MKAQLRRAYKVQYKHAEVYTGGPVALVPGNLGLVLPQQAQLNTINFHDTSVQTLPFVEDESRIMAVAAHERLGKIAVAYASDMVRVYEPTLVSEDTQSNNDMEVDSNITRYKWTEVSKWRCQLVQWLAWDNFVGNNNPFVACASADGTLKVFDQKGQFCTHNFRGHVGPVTLCKFDGQSAAKDAPHPLVIYSAGQDCTIRCWSLKDSKLLATLTNHMSPVTDLDFYNHSSGRRLVSVGRDKMINVWNIKNFSLLYQIPVYESIESMCLIPPKAQFPRTTEGAESGVHVVTGGESGLIKIWNIDAKKLVYDEKTKSADFQIDYLVLDKENLHLYEVTNQQNIICRELSTMNVLKTLVGFNDEIIDIKAINSESIAVATNSAQVRVFSLPDFSCKFLGQSDPNAQHTDTILTLSVSHDGKYIASGSKDQKIIVWDVESGAAVAQLNGHASDVTSVAFFHKTNRYLASTGNDMTWKLWDLKQVVSGHKGFTVISSSAITLRAHGKDVNAIAISPNDQLLATASQDKTVKLFKFNTKTTMAQEWATLIGHKRGVWDIAFSPVEQCVATGSGDRTIKLWSLSDFSCLKTFEGHTGTVLRVQFVTAGTQLLSVGADGLIKLWNIHSNECINTFDQHTEKIWGLSVINDGEFFVSGGADSSIIYWADNTKQEEEEQLKAKEQAVLAEQSLVNSLRSKDYRKALRLAFKLDKPFKTLQIFDQIIKDTVASSDNEEGLTAKDLQDKADALLGELISEFSEENLEKCLFYLRDWNTNAKHSLVAQRVLYHILRVYSPESLAKIPRMRELLQGLIPYSMRHLQRLDRLLQRSYLVDYTLQSMQLLDDITTRDISIEESS